MTYQELQKKIELINNSDKDEKEKKKEVGKLKALLKNAVSYSEDINDPETAVVMYTTKQMNLFLALERGVCRRIRKGFYVNKQDYLLEDLRGKSKKKALEIMKFDCSKFKDIDWSKIKFEMIENELEQKFWSF